MTPDELKALATPYMKQAVFEGMRLGIGTAISVIEKARVQAQFGPEADAALRALADVLREQSAAVETQ